MITGRKIGTTALFMSLIGFMFIAGTVEHLPPEAGLKEWLNLIGASVTAFGLGLFGISLIGDE